MGLYWWLPQTFVPTEDRGSFLTVIRAPQGSTSAYTDQAMIVVSHDPHFRRRIATRGLTLADGRLHHPAPPRCKHAAVEPRAGVE